MLHSPRADAFSSKFVALPLCIVLWFFAARPLCMHFPLESCCMTLVQMHFPLGFCCTSSSPKAFVGMHFPVGFCCMTFVQMRFSLFLLRDPCADAFSSFFPAWPSCRSFPLSQTSTRPRRSGATLVQMRLPLKFCCVALLQMRFLLFFAAQPLRRCGFLWVRPPLAGNHALAVPARPAWPLCKCAFL